MKKEKPKYLFDSEEDKKKRIKIGIERSGPLLMDLYVLHPFVRVHVVDLNTCKYLAKVDKDEPGVYNKETAAVYGKLYEHIDLTKTKDG